MSQKRGKKLRAYSSAFIIAMAVLVGTILVIVLPTPEVHRVTSGDGDVYIDGVWHVGVAAPSISLSNSVGPFIVLAGPAYEIIGPTAPLGSPYTLTFVVPPALVGSAVLYNYNADLDAWQTYPSITSANSLTVSAQAQSLPQEMWGVGSAVTAGRPPSEPSLLSDLMSAPPPRAVGYEVTEELANASGDAVVLNDPLDSGGCGGMFSVGTSTTKTSREVPFAGATYRLIVDWQIGNGCTPGVNLSSARGGM